MKKQTKLTALSLIIVIISFFVFSIVFEFWDQIKAFIIALF